MAGRGEVSWKTRHPDGGRREVRVLRHRHAWQFFSRSGRFDRWMPVAEPSLEDWLKLLDGLERRAGRRLCRPEDVDDVRRLIRLEFPSPTPRGGMPPPG